MSDDLPTGAVRLPRPTPSEQLQINELMRGPRSYTHAVIFYNNRQQPQFGTAVAIRDGERLFALTTAHNVCDSTMISFRLNNQASRKQYSILKTYIHPKYDPEEQVSKFDLAILLLEQNPSISACDVGQLFTGSYRKPTPEEGQNTVQDSTVWVVGNPSGLVEPIENGFAVKQIAFATQIFEACSDQISLRYPESVYRMPQDGTTCELGSMEPTPHGYSGGGAWRTINPPDELFNPHRHIKLIGIQSHWSGKKERLLRFVPSNVIIEALNEFKSTL